MGIDQAVRGVVAGIGDAPDADFAVVVWEIVDQPVDGVIGIGAVIEVAGAVKVGFVRADVYKRAFGHVAAADVLVDENESLCFGGFGRADADAVVISSVWGDRVGRALHQDRIFLRRVLRDVDACEQTDAIAHGDAEFVLGVVGAGIGELFTIRVVRGEHYNRRRKKGRQGETE